MFYSNKDTQRLGQCIGYRSVARTHGDVIGMSPTGAHDIVTINNECAAVQKAEDPPHPPGFRRNIGQESPLPASQ